MLGCLRERCIDLAGQWKYIVCAPDWPNSNTVLKTRESKRGGSAQGLHPAASELGADLGDELRRVVEVGGSVAEEGDARADEVVLRAVVGSQVVARGVPSTRVSRGGGLQGGVPPQRWVLPSYSVPSPAARKKKSSRPKNLPSSSWICAANPHKCHTLRTFYRQGATAGGAGELAGPALAGRAGLSFSLTAASVGFIRLTY